MAKKNRIPQVAILISTSNGWGRQIIKGILSYTKEAGPWHVLIRPNHEPVETVPVGWRGDGVIAHVKSPEIAKELRASGLPVVNVADMIVDGFSSPCIRTDDQAGAELAADYFTGKGFRNIGFVGSNHSPNPVWYGQAFEKIIKERDLSFSAFYLKGDASDQSAEMTQWLFSLPKPAAILVWGHSNGRTVVDCCMEAGISVPHDVAVLCGSYDELLSHACFPEMSGICAPTEQIGYAAAKKLHQMMNGETVPNETTYMAPTGIIERLSTATIATDDPKLVKVIDFIQLHAYESITMSDILAAVPMARRSLERRFKQVFGRSPHDEIRRIRINKARELLTDTDLPMQNIAEACGYSTYNYLTQAFKKTTGLTPSMYRKESRKA